MHLEAAGEEHVAAGIRIATAYGFPLLLSFFAIGRGWLLVHEGRAAEGIALLGDGLEQQQAPGVGLTRVPHLDFFAEAYGRAGSPDHGLAVLDEAFDLVEHGGEHKVDALLHCLRGELLDALGCDVQAAEASMPRARDRPRAGAKSFALRVALSLARRCQAQGRNGEARDLVAGVYGWFTEGFEAPDLTAARVLLGCRVRVPEPGRLMVGPLA